VKLLLDENLSRKIVPALQDAFPGTTQVALVGLEHSNDRAVWNFAKAEEFTIVTKDDDFLALLSLLGYPPKVVLLALGNCTSQQIIDTLTGSRAEIERMLVKDDVGLVEVY
jgi:predicted nuclease of predicted toxin-antitoxin system